MGPHGGSAPNAQVVDPGQAGLTAPSHRLHFSTASLRPMLLCQERFEYGEVLSSDENLKAWLDQVARCGNPPIPFQLLIPRTRSWSTGTVSHSQETPCHTMQVPLCTPPRHYAITAGCQGAQLLPFPIPPMQIWFWTGARHSADTAKPSLSVTNGWMSVHPPPPSPLPAATCVSLSILRVPMLSLNYAVWRVSRLVY